ncbi:hypothetical protein [Comamonas aquatica]|uniref:hypothetical protein n=1 Tax=Comamonas aquatica TaxID=225991 RepID=UPI0031D4B4AE
MKETGLMFKAPLVRAILEGRKTQTRRVAKPVKHPDLGNLYTPGALVMEREPQHVIDRACPLGRPGDRIYVRETWADLIAVSPSTDEPMAIGPGERLIEAPTSWTDDKGRTRWHFDGQVIAYRANSNVEFCDGDGFTGEFADKSDMPRWRPSIHMPKEFARIWLEITGVRVERLQDISEDDADAEGCERLETERYERDWKLCPKCGGTRLHDALGAGLGVIHDVDCRECDTYVKRFRHLWLSTGGDWDANPWVWVIDFKTISTNGRPA